MTKLISEMGYGSGSWVLGFTTFSWFATGALSLFLEEGNLVEHSLLTIS